MTDIFIIFSITIVREYYRTHAIFFLLVGGIAGGFMRSQDHIALAEYFVGSPTLLLLPISIWIMYALNVVKSNTNIITFSENEFLFCFPFFSRYTRWSVVLLTAIVELAPIILYGFFLIATSVKYDLSFITSFLVVTLVVMLVIVSFYLNKKLHTPNTDKNDLIVFKWLNKLVVKPSSLFFIEWIVRREPVIVIGTKIFGLLLLIALTQLYTTDTYDERLLSIGVIVVMCAQSNLTSYLHRFDNHYFSMLRSLPFTIVKRQLSVAITVCVLFSLEIGFLITHFPKSLNISSALSSVALVMSIPLFFYGLLTRKAKKQEELMTLTFFICIGWIIITLYKVPILLIAAGNSGLGFYWLLRNFYNFEYSLPDKIKE